MKICITMDLLSELSDPDHEMGVTEACYEELTDALSSFGDNIEVTKAEPLT